MQEKDSLFRNGIFFIGVNCWASNTGTNMWHDRDENTVKRDPYLLAKNGEIKVIVGLVAGWMSGRIFIFPYIGGT